ncbi:FAD-binding protein [Sphingosinicella soli]|uniref:3-oxosteroid 1-dehydrogenase n=1 Tax=Sphingosinicella soli TaxID=333708 RepID=A0A7W7B6B2_9SPHN|nr:FAD-binding protein [Sphingosinicella soli]MBB4633840.1 3-oxosteroid 1-dehydrogenase [Sphingosinicella soli]
MSKAERLKEASGTIHDSYDWVVVGSGAGAVIAGLLAKSTGRTVLILEKESKVGGSTALSGGVLWIPNNSVMKEAGMADSYEDARTYLNACAGEPTPGSTFERREAYLRGGPEAIDFLRAEGMKFESPEGYSDYHEGEYPGAVSGGRAIVARLFDLNELGEYADTMLRFPAGEIPAAVPEATLLTLSGRGWASKRAYVKVGLRMLRKKLGSQLVGMGAALQGRLFKLALEHGLQIVTDAPVTEMLVENDRVVGVVLLHKGERRTVRSKLGVLLDAGGFSRNEKLRSKYQRAPGSTAWTFANPGDTGEMLEEGIRLGADTNHLDLSVWVTSSLPPGQPPVWTLGDMAKPHAILVDDNGQRFVNEATSYVKVGEAMYERNKMVSAVPSWIIMDRQHHERYFMAGTRPGKIKTEWLEQGFIVEAQSIEELETKCGISPGGLVATVDRFNDFCRTGQDEDFHRGRSKWDNFLGDRNVKPNPNLGEISKPPFRAMRAYPGDVGTWGGLVTDEYARVLRKDGSIIEGLYAAGNITAPVMGRSYPGAGASIGPALVFSYIATRHALGMNS